MKKEKMKPVDGQDAAVLSTYDVVSVKGTEVIIGPLKGLGDQKFVPSKGGIFEGKGFCIFGKFAQLNSWSPIKNHICVVDNQSFLIESQREHQDGMLINVSPINSEASRMFRLAAMAKELKQRRKLARRARYALRNDE